MAGKRHRIAKSLGFLLAILSVTLVWLPRAWERTSAAATPYRVHIAFGFHVNLYHSFRGDTNDANGFGQDIRVIRHIISELDRFNQAGIPVSAVWDFDNLFSLETLLPAHAPDILQDVQRRVREDRDEVILMSYNNGLAAAMNHEEFMASVQMAISNENGSGVRDLFGKVTPVVRPQEMMTTPGNFKRYRELGIDYVSLYYSATPFDAFRVFSRELTPTEAHNPIRYQNPASGEEITIIPTYHPGDLVEHVSLREWAAALHRLQAEGQIDRDVLLFINFDADAEFWAGADLPWHLDWLPNTGGIAQLVSSVADLAYVRFTKLGDYLAHHSPAGTVRFTQDTADGSFHGFNSWAEKASTTEYWTRILRNRRATEAARRVAAMAGDLSSQGPPELSPRQLETNLETAFALRLRALSTTNFGLATPFLARQREAAMAELLARLDETSDRLEAFAAARAQALIQQTAAPRLPPWAGPLVETIVHLNRQTAGGAAGESHLDLVLPAHLADNFKYLLVDPSGHRIPARTIRRVPGPDGRSTALILRAETPGSLPDGVYFIHQPSPDPSAPSPDSDRIRADRHLLTNGAIAVHFDDRGHVTEVTHGGTPMLVAGSLIPYFTHNGQRHRPERLTVTVAADGAQGIASVRLSGPWEGPPGRTRRPGWINYRLRLLRGDPYLYIDGTVRYPDTVRDTVIQAQKPMLARKIDKGWEAVAPLELRFAPRTHAGRPFRIHKRNYLGEAAAYPVDYFRHALENRHVTSINNHITAAYAGVTAAGQGMAVALNPTVSANFAFCPFRMTHVAATDRFAIRANPFGTYAGRQILPPTRGNRQGYEAVLQTAPQFHSAAPTFNGHRLRFGLMVAFFDGDLVPADVQGDLIAFAQRGQVISAGDTARPARADAEREGRFAPLPPAGFLALPHATGVVFQWDVGAPPGTIYHIHCRGLADSGPLRFTTRAHSLLVDKAAFTPSDGAFQAAIEAHYPDGAISAPSPEIRFHIDGEIASEYTIPLDLKAKVFMANVGAWFRRLLL
ncbi:MAG: hypothetical protein QNJ22_06035 [Desulfosarcinaceae bacterium]|nr:hypothetical protein [Desulfosarcinaceae bacterium]